MKKVLCCSKLLILFLFTFSVSKIYSGLFSGYDKKKPEEIVHDLAIEQINSPNDPYINYNLGVALYQTHKYEAAKNNFERAVGNAKNKKLKEYSYFNLANSCYKNALSCLPVNWENESTKIEQDKLAVATDNAKSAIKNYESLLDLSKEHEHAKTNLKKAKDLVENLMKKQQQQKQDDKKDKDNKKGEQDKQDKKDKQEGDKSKQDQQNQQQKQDGQQDKSQDKSSEGEKKQNQSGDQQQNSQQDKSQKESSGQEEGQDQIQSAEQKESQQAKESDQQAQAQNAQEQRDSQQQGFAQAAQKESAEEKSMRLMLENLQSDEDSLQKLIIQRQTKDQKPLQSGQKPW